MSKKDKAVEAIRNAIHENCKDMTPRDFQDVLEEIDADIEGHIGAIKEEAEEAE